MRTRVAAVLCVMLAPCIARAQIDVEARRALVTSQLALSVGQDAIGRETAYREAVRIAAPLGADDPDRAEAELALATALAETDRCDEAVPMLERLASTTLPAVGRAARVRRAICRLQTNETAAAEAELASLRAGMSDQDRLEILEGLAVAQIANDHLDAALATAREIGALGDFEASMAAQLRGIVLFRRSRTSDAIRQLSSSIDHRVPISLSGDAAHIRESLGTASEDADRFLAALLSAPADAQTASLAFGVALLVRGRVLDALGRTTESRDREPSIRTELRLERLRTLRGRLARSLLEPGADPSMLRRDASEAARLESTLSGNLTTTLESSSEIARRVGAAVPADAVLIEIVRFRPRTVPGAFAATAAGPPELAALVWPGGGSPTFVRLGSAAEIDAAVARFREAVMLPALHPNDDPATHLPAAIAAGRALHDRVWAPLSARIAGRSRVLFAGHGALNLVPLGALHDGRGFLAARLRFHYLTSGRDLVRASRPPLGTELIAFGDPDYARPIDGAGALARYRFEPLAHARAELDAVRAMFGDSRSLVGPDATERALLEVHAPAILHIASHGLFAGSTAGGARGSRGIRVSADPPAPGRTDELSALARSALVLTRSDRASDGDGLATALEIASMDLRGTELVTLSACESGVGLVSDGDGVHGLRRAFLVAGARALITALWSVDDESTRELMTRFYARYARGGISVEDALQSAIDGVRRERPHPLFWAPFVSVGSPGTVHTVPAPIAPLVATPEPPTPVAEAASVFIPPRRWAALRAERWSFDCTTALSGPGSFAFVTAAPGEVNVSASGFIVARTASGETRCGRSWLRLADVPAGRIDVWLASDRSRSPPPRAFVTHRSASSGALVHAASRRSLDRLPSSLPIAVSDTDPYTCELAQRRPPDVTLHVGADLGPASITVEPGPVFAMRDPSGSPWCHSGPLVEGEADRPFDTFLHEGDYDFWFPGGTRGTLRIVPRAAELWERSATRPTGPPVGPAPIRREIDPSGPMAPIVGALQPLPDFAAPGATCDGQWWRAYQPTYELTIARAVDRMRILATSHEDTTLVVRLPSGEEHCSLDAYGLHPAYVGAVPRGRVQIWIAAGRALLGDAPYRIALEQGRGIEAPSPLASFDWSRRDELEQLAQRAARVVRATTDPVRIDTAFRPTVPTQLVGPTCGEDFRAHPDPVARVQVGEGARVLRLVAVSPGPSSVLVRHPDGRYQCSPTADYHGWLDLAAPAAGEYVVWLGDGPSWNPISQTDGTLFVQLLPDAAR